MAEESTSLTPGEIDALERQSYFRELIDSRIKSGYLSLLIASKEERRVQSFFDATISSQPTTEEIFESIPKIRHLLPETAEEEIDLEGVQLPKSSSEALDEKQKIIYRKNLAGRVITILKQVDGDEAKKVVDEIIDKKNNDPNNTSLFWEIQQQLLALQDEPDEELEEVLKDARSVLEIAADEAGILQSANANLKIAQEAPDYTRQVELVGRIKLDILENQAAYALNRSSIDFVGMNTAYIQGARLWMQWGALKALGLDENSAEIMKEIELVGWGKNREIFADRAEAHLQKLQNQTGMTGKRGEQRVLVEEMSEGEREYLDRLDEELVFNLVEDVMDPAVKKVGDNVNIFPYLDEHRILEVADKELVKYIKDIEKVMGRNLESDRAKEVIGRLEKIRSWYEGSMHFLQGAGPVLDKYYDGLLMMLVVRERTKLDINMNDFYNLFSGLGELKDCKIGQEIVKKQDDCFEIMRGISAVHRNPGRNMGKKVVGGDYPLNEAQIEFVESVFASKGWVKRTASPPGGEEDQEVIEVEVAEKIETIGEIFGREKAYDEIRDRLEKKEEGEVVSILVGEEYEIDNSLIEGIPKKHKKFGPNTVWVDGVDWKIGKDIDPATLEAIMVDLKRRVGSGDKIFFGERIDITLASLSEYKDKITKRENTAIIKSSPGAIDNLFVMAQDPNTISLTKRKIDLMLEMGIWGKLEEDNVDTKQLLEEFNQKLSKYSEGSLNQHIIDMTRIQLLYFMEGARLGWGFEYEKDDKLGVYKRIVSEGGTKACTDIGTPFNYLYVEGKNNWKDWTHGPIPMDKNMAYQLSLHEPGWAPKLVNGIWELTFMGKKIKMNAPRIFKMSLMEAIRITKGKVGFKGERMMDLVTDRNKKERKKMSEVPWLDTDRDAPYRTYVTWGQTVIPMTILSKPPDNETLARYSGLQGTVIKSLAPLYEWIKRVDLGFRDMAKAEDVKRMVPLVEALLLLYTRNVLPISPRPGDFLDREIYVAARESRRSLTKLAPKGDEVMARSIVNIFNYQIDRFLDTGKDYKVERARIK